MSKFYKFPTKIITQNDLNNIFGLLSRQIAIRIKSINNIVSQKEYRIFINSIYDLCREKILYYDFNSIDTTKIFYLNVEISNMSINQVAIVNFIITKFYYLYSYSEWNTFIKNNITNTGVVYKNLNSTQQNQLNYSIVQDSFYYLNNINITTITPNGIGLILKLSNFNSYSDCECECEYDCLNNDNYNSQNYIVSIYWYFSI